MKKLLLLFISGVASLHSFGQAAVSIVEPTNIAGEVSFSYPQPTAWGMLPDIAAFGFFVEDTAIWVNDGSANPTFGCTTLPANSMAGKIALVMRGSCEFGLKALNAQNAGAVGVVIVNNVDEVIAMGGGTSGSTVNIPVVMVPSSVGTTITTAQTTSTVEMFIGNKAGLSPHDLGFLLDLTLIPSYGGMSSLLAAGTGDFVSSLGMRIYNYGSSAVTAGRLNATVMGPTNNEVYNQSVTFTMDGVTGNVMDSLDVFPGETLFLPDLDLGNYPPGKYTLTYTLSEDETTDASPLDNTFTTHFTIGNLISRARINNAGDFPLPGSLASPAAPTGNNGVWNEIRYCSSFGHANADRVAITEMLAYVGLMDTTGGATLAGTTAFATVYEWNDVITNYAQTTFNALAEVSSAEYTFEDAVINGNVTFTFEEPIMVENNKKYLFCLVDYSNSLGLGYDRDVPYNANNQQYLFPASPLYVNAGSATTQWYRGGFTGHLAPSIALRAVSVDALNVKKLSSIDGSVFPNPVNDMVNINIALDGKAVVTVTDLAGRTVQTNNVTFESNNAQVSLADLNAGMYILNVVYANGAKTSFNVVKK